SRLGGTAGTCSSVGGWTRNASSTGTGPKPASRGVNRYSRSLVEAGNLWEPGTVMAAAIEVRGLRKSYGDVEAVKGIDLSVAEGTVFALLGPNGAGKTTTVEILEGFRARTAGEISVLGFDPARRDRSLRSHIGIVLQSTGVDPYLTVAETVELYGGYYEHPRPLDEVIEVVGLNEKAEAKV